MRPLLLFLGVSVLVRCVALFLTGFCDDEAYVVTIARVPMLSYFDHPPLHQWILSGWTALFGEGRAARLPFLGFFLFSNGMMFVLARRLFSTPAAWWTLFIFNANSYFLLFPDGYIMPDPPLMAFSLLSLVLVAEILFGSGRRLLWLALGVSLGLAGLCKYSAVFLPLGLLGFALTSPQARGWFRNPYPYYAAALALALQAPTLIWNAQHHWVSLAFQIGRAGHRLTFNTRALQDILQALGAQIASMTPWLLIPLLVGLARSLRREAANAERLLAWQAVPPLLVFSLLPLMGERPIAHWFNASWLMAFPLAGAWMAEQSALFQRRFGILSAGLAAGMFLLYITALTLPPLAIAGMRNATEGMIDYPAAPLRNAFHMSGADFVLVDNWRLAGRLGVALGPKVAICAFGNDPRGLAFACDANIFRGQKGLIVHRSDKSLGTDLRPFFHEIKSLGSLPIGNRQLSLAVGQDLLYAPPLPYGP